MRTKNSRNRPNTRKKQAIITLNTLLRFAGIDLATLSDGDAESLAKEIIAAIQGDPECQRSIGFLYTGAPITRAMLREAQLGIQRIVKEFGDARQ